ncbi:hypothetical protein B566_EDAN002679 [Ephemera danica]|nr:hypothetical protein B566_EDAN002679 [Ephemera danica]
MPDFWGNEKLVYAFRGWIAFVAFMDLGTAVRCFIEKRTFLDDAVFLANSTENVNQDPAALPRVLGAYSVLKATILVHCALFIHYRPIISIAIFSLVITLIIHTSECFYFQTAPFGFYVIFPGLINTLTLIGLATIPRYLQNVDGLMQTAADENSELLRQAGVQRRKRMHHRNQ